MPRHPLQALLERLLVRRVMRTQKVLRLQIRTIHIYSENSILSILKAKRPIKGIMYCLLCKSIMQRKICIISKFLYKVTYCASRRYCMKRVAKIEHKKKANSELLE